MSSMLPDREDSVLKDIAKRVVSNEIFLTNKPEIIELSWSMVLMFMEESLPENLGSLYEEYNKAMPRSVNGYPMFGSMSMLSQNDTTKVVQYIEKIQEAMNSI